MTDPQKSLTYHRQLKGKTALHVKSPIKSKEDLSLAYTPGVAEPCKAIAKNVDEVWEMTARGNWIAIVTDGSAVLGLGNIGPEAALPVMEGKAILFKQFGDVDAFPICLATQDTDEIIETIKRIAPSVGGINLEDISAPRCFEIEKRLDEELDIPVFHDDQHGTAIVVLAGLMNALKLTNRTLVDASIVISGAGAAGTAIATMLSKSGTTNIVMTDRHGIINANDDDLSDAKKKLLAFTNPEDKTGSLSDALMNTDVFIGVSAPNIVTEAMIKSMNADPIIFAMANPDPEVMPDVAARAGAAIVATGRSDFPNQVNNALAFPGIFRGTLDARSTTITDEMKLAAAEALAAFVTDPTPEKILPEPLEPDVANAVAEAMKHASA